MGLFARRRARDRAGDTEPQQDVREQGARTSDDEGDADAVATSATGAPTRGDGRGPWDASEVPDLGARLDLGALRVPGLPGMQLRMEMDQKGSRAVAANLGYEASALQIQAFAAPRSYGIWDELRAELAASVTKQGGTADEVPGPFGTELLARLPVRTPEGRTGHRPARFIGVDGPRWFLRGVLTGRAAVEPGAATDLERVFAEIVVVRGDDARPPRDLLPLHLPGRGPVELPGAAGEGVTGQGAAGEGVSDPLRRGPEITETR